MISIGLVGCGEAGREHMRAYQTMPDVKVRGVYDPDLNRSQTLAQEFGTLSLSFEELVQQVDLVDICSPITSHWENIRQIQNVRGILCEAPIAPNLQEAKAILAYCEQHELPLFPVHRAGFSGPLAKIREFIVEDPQRKTGMIRITRRGHLKPFPSLDNIDTSDSISDFTSDSSPHSTSDSTSDSDLIARVEQVFLETLFEDFAFLQKTFGPIARIYASSTVRPSSIEVYALVSLKFNNGSMAHLNANLLQEPSIEDVEFAYPDGLITYSEATASPLWFKFQNHGVVNGGTLSQEAYTMALNNIINAVLSNSTARYTPEDSFRTLEAALGAAESARTRQVLKFRTVGGRSDG